MEKGWCIEECGVNNIYILLQVLQKWARPKMKRRGACMKYGV